ASSSTSLRDSIFEYSRGKGKVCHQYQDGGASGPTIDCEPTRHLDLEHALWPPVNDENFDMTLPCRKGAKVGRVLDVGTGTGIWALDFGDGHSWSEVSFVPSSTPPIQLQSPPPNFKSEVDDAEDTWAYPQPDPDRDKVAI
ncbi:hypothetical protein LX32DRAFT_590115, partial [Colletotrichum zoysiae]